MVWFPFRKNHLIRAWEEYEKTHPPVDLFLKRYFKKHHSLGSKDRRYIGDLFYKAVRFRSLIKQNLRSDDWFDAVENFDPTHHKEKDLLPSFLYERLEKQYGEKEALNLARISSEEAPVTARANILKTDREKITAKLADRFHIRCTPFSQNGFTFSQRSQLTHLPEFREGLFEIQDEGSQLLADLIDPEGGAQILDYCAGSGGKTLAFAPKLGKRGQIYLYDIRQHALEKAKRRLRRAGIQNSQCIDAKGLKRLKGKMDWILVDAPCSGTGTLRRNPDIRWKLSTPYVEELVAIQRNIVENVLPLLKPGGKLVYATCSLLAEENEEQIAYFTKNFPLTLKSLPFQTLPLSGGMDGFFGAVMVRSPS